MQNKMTLLSIGLILVILVASLFYSLNRTKKQSSNEIANMQTSTNQYKNITPSFVFDYPNLEGYKITTGSNFINYEIPPSELEGRTGAHVDWIQTYIKVTADYWDKQKVNKRGIQYSLSEDENVLDFRLKNQGSVIRFNVGLPGSYLRKKQIIDTITDSFEETTVKE
jgi:hypothetical protein